MNTSDQVSGHKRQDGEERGNAAEVWNERYREHERVWSGNVNDTLAGAVEWIEQQRPLCYRPRALDLGCGEGGDVLWLAQRGYHAFGVDISSVAIDRARARADELSIAKRVHVQAADLETWDPATAEWGSAETLSEAAEQSRDRDAGFDLITASFFQSFSHLNRAGVLQRAATWLLPGGALVLLSHAAPPSWATEEDHHGRSMEFPSEESERALFAEGLMSGRLVVRREELITRAVTGHHGHDGTLTDLLMVFQRMR